MRHFSSFAATPECPNVGTAPAGVIQSAAPTEAANTAAKSHAHEATKLREQPPSLIWTVSSNGEPPSSSGCLTAIPLPTKLWYKSRNPTCFYQPIFTTGSKSWGSTGQPQQHGEQRHDGKPGRTVWHWDQSSDAADCLPVPRIRYEGHDHVAFTSPACRPLFLCVSFSDTKWLSGLRLFSLIAKVIKLESL